LVSRISDKDWHRDKQNKIDFASARRFWEMAVTVKRGGIATTFEEEKKTVASVHGFEWYVSKTNEVDPIVTSNDPGGWTVDAVADGYNISAPEDATPGEYTLWAGGGTGTHFQYPLVVE
jgi:hypothetical protein